MLFVAFFVVALVFGNVLAPVPFPPPFAPSEEVLRYFAESQAATWTQSFLPAVEARKETS